MYDPGNAATGHPASSYQMVTCWSDGQLFRPPRCRYRVGAISRNGPYGTLAPYPPQSALMPANLITLPHLSVSLAISRPKSAGVIGIGVPPKSSSRAFIFWIDESGVGFLVQPSNWLGVVSWRPPAPTTAAPPCPHPTLPAPPSPPPPPPAVAQSPPTAAPSNCSPPPLTAAPRR